MIDNTLKYLLESAMYGTEHSVSAKYRKSYLDNIDKYAPYHKMLSCLAVAIVQDNHTWYKDFEPGTNLDNIPKFNVDVYYWGEEDPDSLELWKYSKSFDNKNDAIKYCDSLKVPASKIGSSNEDMYAKYGKSQSSVNFSKILNKNIEATKKKIPSMNIKELISTWLSGYHPECLSLALQKIVENENKYPKIAKLFYELQDELTKLSGSNKNFSERLRKCFSFIYHVRLTDRSNKSKSVSIDNLEAGSWQEAVDKVISEHPEFGLKPGDYDGSDKVEVHWNYDGKTLKSF